MSTKTCKTCDNELPLTAFEQHVPGKHPTNASRAGVKVVRKLSKMQSVTQKRPSCRRNATDATKLPVLTPNSNCATTSSRRLRIGPRAINVVTVLILTSINDTFKGSAKQMKKAILRATPKKCASTGRHMPTKSAPGRPKTPTGV